MTDLSKKIDSLTVVNKKISAFTDARLLEIDAKNLDIEKLQADNELLAEFVKRLVELPAKNDPLFDAVFTNLKTQAKQFMSKQKE